MEGLRGGRTGRQEEGERREDWEVGGWRGRRTGRGGRTERREEGERWEDGEVGGLGGKGKVGGLGGRRTRRREDSDRSGEETNGQRDTHTQEKTMRREERETESERERKQRKEGGRQQRAERPSGWGAETDGGRNLRKRSRTQKHGERTPVSPSTAPHGDAGEAPSVPRGLAGAPTGSRLQQPSHQQPPPEWGPPQAHRGWAPCSVPNWCLFTSRSLGFLICKVGLWPGAQGHWE